MRRYAFCGEGKCYYNMIFYLSLFNSDVYIVKYFFRDRKLR